MKELLEARRNGSGGDLVGLTFDDGYADFAENAFPVLSRYGFTATAFVLAGRFGGYNAWVDGVRKPLMTAEQVRQVAAGGIEIGSHGLHHVSLPSISDADLKEEIEVSRRIIQDVSGQEIPGFCYPYGNHDGRAVRSAQASGYDYCCAVGYSEFTGRYALPRIDIINRDSSLRLWAKGTRYWLRWEYHGPGSRILIGASDLRARRWT